MWPNPNYAQTPVSNDPRSLILRQSERPNSTQEDGKTLCNAQVPQQWQQLLLADISAARTSIYATALSMLPVRAGQKGPWPATWNALCARAAEKIIVEITLPAPTKASVAPSQNAKAAALAHAHGITVHLIRGARLLHAKQWIIDNHIIWIGSANMTAAAYAYNHERWARIESTEIAGILIDDITKLHE